MPIGTSQRARGIEHRRGGSQRIRATNHATVTRPLAVSARCTRPRAARPRATRRRGRTRTTSAVRPTSVATMKMPSRRRLRHRPTNVAPSRRLDRIGRGRAVDRDHGLGRDPRAAPAPPPESSRATRCRTTSTCGSCPNSCGTATGCRSTCRCSRTAPRLAFPYAFIPWMVAALLWPLMGEWSVTLVLGAGFVGLVLATFWAFPELRRGWWTVAVLVNPALVEALLLGQLPFLWAATMLDVRHRLLADRSAQGRRDARRPGTAHACRSTRPADCAGRADPLSRRAAPARARRSVGSSRS